MTAVMDRIAPGYELLRVPLADGASTTVHAVLHPLDGLRPRLAVFAPARRLDKWCARSGHAEAMTAGFFVRDPHRPLGELWIDGERQAHEPFPHAVASYRPVLHLPPDGPPQIVRRHALPAYPDGDGIQAGPLLLEGGEVSLRDDLEGFSSGAGQFDSDITRGRYPRSAVGLTDTHLVALACDGRRTGVDAGLTLSELAVLLRDRWGCHAALNLDGGGSATLVHHGHLINRPYAAQDEPAPRSRPIVTALVFG
jgi:hypothetical protein